MVEGRCFVMQPFDRGKFDRRYLDTFAPAIAEAGLEPYRVDEDPAASIPIDEVERQIKLARVCFAEITTDNPNVWFELGYALACNKDVCLVCSTERIGKFPFDVQHRQIIKYDTNSASDFNTLRSNIVKRLQAICLKSESIAALEQKDSVAPTSGLSPHEITTLIIMLEGRNEPSEGLSGWIIREEIGRFGYTKAAAQIALEKLRIKGLVSSEVKLVDEDHHAAPQNITFYHLTDKGILWLLNNEDKLQLRLPSKNRTREQQVEDDIPF